MHPCLSLPLGRQWSLPTVLKLIRPCLITIQVIIFLDIISLIYLVLPEHVRTNNPVIGFRSVFVGIEQNPTRFNWNYPYPIGSDWDIWTWYHTCIVLPPFDVRKAENYLEKTGNDRSFTVKKQKTCFWYKTIFNLVSVW